MFDYEIGQTNVLGCFGAHLDTYVANVSYFNFLQGVFFLNLCPTTCIHMIFCNAPIWIAGDAGWSGIHDPADCRGVGVQRLLQPGQHLRRLSRSSW